MSPVLGLAAMAGGLSTGFLLDRFKAGGVAAGFILAMVIFSVLTLAFPGVIRITIPAVILLGLSVGAEVNVLAYLVTRYFGLRSFGVTFATIGGFMAIANGAGPVGISLIYDNTASYHLGLLASIPICIVSALLILSLGRYPDFTPAVAVETPRP
jgi:MFS family permease